MAKRATVRITGTEKAKKNAESFLKGFTKNNAFLNELGKLTADQIKGRVRNLGRNDSEYSQDDLSTYTIKQRERLVRAGNAYNTTVVKKDRSNLSMSGQLLDAIKWRVLSGAAEVKMFIERSRKPYKGINKKELELKDDNLDIKENLEEQGRRFFFISEKLSTLLETKIAQELRRKLSLFNKITRR